MNVKIKDFLEYWWVEKLFSLATHIQLMMRKQFLFFIRIKMNKIYIKFKSILATVPILYTLKTKGVFVSSGSMKWEHWRETG